MVPRPKRTDCDTQSTATPPKKRHRPASEQLSDARQAAVAASCFDPESAAPPIDQPGIERRSADCQQTGAGKEAAAGRAEAAELTGQWSTSAGLAAEAAALVRDMLRANMEPHYGAEWPAEWRRKRRNVLHPDSRYLLMWGNGARQRGLAGFVQYRFVEEDGRPVLYLYEVQVASEERGRGVGRRMLRAMAHVGEATGMAALMLTVQINNEAASAFYARCGFQEDETSPGLCDPAGAAVSKYSYRILSKAISRQLADW